MSSRLAAVGSHRRPRAPSRRVRWVDQARYASGPPQALALDRDRAAVSSPLHAASPISARTAASGSRRRRGRACGRRQPSSPRRRARPTRAPGAGQQQAVARTRAALRTLRRRSTVCMVPHLAIDAVTPGPDFLQSRSSPTGTAAMPVNLQRPRPRRPAPRARRAHRHRDGRRAQGQPARPGACSRSTRAPRWPASSRSNRFCAAPVQLCREHLAAGGGIRALRRSTPATPTPAPAPTAWRARAAPAPRWPALLGLQPRAGAAVFHRRDHGDAAGRAHRGRPAGGAGRAARPTSWAEAAAGHHDHRHAAQGGVAPGARSAAAPSPSPASAKGAGMIRPEHGHDARLRGHRRRDRAGAAAARWCARRPTAASTASRSTATPRPTTPSC